MSVGSPEARDRVTGRARYAQDIPAEDPLYAAVVRSPHPHARILSIDTSAAAAMPGVAVVLSAEDIGDRRFGRFTRDYPVFAVDRVLFAGQPVVAVAARDQHTARAAARLVVVDYEPLPAILRAEEALAPDAVVIHPDYADYVNPVPQRRHPNLQGEDAVVTGDPESAFAECDEVFENTFTWSRSVSGAMETHGCLIDATGERVVVHAAHKEPFKLRRDLAALSGRPEEDFEIRPVKIGGDFGSKGNPLAESIGYFLSAATGRPVRVRFSYAEALAATGARHAGSLRLRTGLLRGTLHAHASEFLLDGGAFVASKPMPKGILPMLGLPMGAYDVPHQSETAVGVYTNTVQGAHVRSPGEFQTIFAAESHLEMIAARRGEHPADFKARHVHHPVARELIGTVRRASADWGRGGARDGGLLLGTGYSVFHRSAGPGESTVRLTASSQGVLLELATPDQGAGSFEAFAALVAGRLGLDRRLVTVRGRGTDSGLVDQGAGASRVTVVVGRACAEACRQLTELLRPAGLSSVEPVASVGSVAAALATLDGEVTVTGTGTVGRGEVDGLGHAHGALALQVTVDPETGFVRATQAVLAADVGPVLNPVGLRGQLEGGFVFGLSQTLFEDLRPRDGIVDLDSFNGYKPASGVDVPHLEIHLSGDYAVPADGLQGVRAVGELVNIGVPAAVANAVADACGVRVTSLPVSAEKILTGLTADAPRTLNTTNRS